MRRADFLLEIGTEEIPAGYVGPAADCLRQRLCAWLDERGLDYEAGGVAAFSTPRRLAVRVGGLALEQARRPQTRLGPAVAAAFDADGRPTKAAEGFARSVQTTVDRLQRVATDKGERLAAVVDTGGASARQLLVEELSLVDLLQLGFPKTMRWIPGRDFRFARPIRWIVCLLGDEVLPLRLEHLSAGRVTRGHRTLAPGPVELASPADYERALENASVVVDPVRRRERILSEARRVAQECGGVLHEDEELLDEVVQLCEHPTAVPGGIDPAKVRLLPPEVIITAMRAHQRYFSVVAPGGGLRPHFITFRDGGDRGLANVVEGNERVLRARLDDASFYWNEDRSVSSDEKLERLDRVVWLEGRGSVKAKCERIAALASSLADELEPAVDRADLRRAALLCKSDLATEMIRDGKEFTKLQGVIGRYYALEAGESADVADAIREHLHPKTAGDRLPEGVLGTLVALADRLDSIAGCVLAGFAPSGGQDPYALRRQSLAVLRILLEHGWHLDLEAWVRRSVEAHGAEREAATAAAAAVEDLFWGRLETVLAELPAEIVRGVLSVSRLDPVENVKAARALSGLRGSESFERLLEGAKRCRNILVKEGRLAEEQLEGAARAHALRSEAARRWTGWTGRVGGGGGGGFDPGRFTDAAEHSLLAAVLERIDRLDGARARADHAQTFATLAELGPAIARYFDEVLVNAPDPELRLNRLGFLEDVHYLFARNADLSRVPVA